MNDESSWIDEYRQKLISPNPDEMDIQAAQLLKLRNQPSRLYRFRPFPAGEERAAIKQRQRTLDEIRTGSVFMAAPTAYNDPYDSSFYNPFHTLLCSVDPKLREKSLSNLLEDGFLSQEEVDELQDVPESAFMRSLAETLLPKDPSLDKERALAVTRSILSKNLGDVASVHGSVNHAIRQGVRICSFTQDVGSLVMWSHYGDGHRGVCLEYDVDSLEPVDLRRTALNPVFYREKKFDARPYIERLVRKQDFNNLWLLLACLHKSPEWAYEEEWRLVNLLRPGATEKTMLEMPLSGVYIGACIDSGSEDLVTKSCITARLPLFKMRLRDHAFELVCDRVETE